MRSSLFLCVVVLAGCGGNWSNSDLAFANALPRTADLKSRLPPGSTTQPLEGVSTRRDGLVVGDPSGAWAQTRKAAADFNGMLDRLLGLVDQVRSLAPSARTPTSRTWGPFADANNPGREVQLSVTKVDEISFEWSIDSRPVGGDFIRIISGHLLAGDTARRGQGNLVVHVKDFRDVVRVDGNVAQLDELVVDYATDRFPNVVEMNFTARPGSTLGLSSLGYTSRLAADGSGAMRFVYSLPGPGVTQLEIVSRWKPTGEGRSLGVVKAGTYAGANVTECWGRQFTVTHYAEGWPGGVVLGPESDCVAFEGL